MSYLEKAREIMAEEPALLRLHDKIMVAGDTHGDVVVAREIVKRFYEEKFDFLVFLGDYVDRRPPDVSASENIDFLLGEKCRNPDKIFLLKGNHEANYAIPCYPNDFEIEMGEKYGEYVKVFREMPIAGLLNNVFVSHGGIIKGKEIERLSKNDFDDIEALTWSDPEIANIYRGAGITYDENDLNDFLEKINARAFIRGHDYNLNGTIVYNKCLTIFSSRLYKNEGNKGILIAKIYGDIEHIEEIEIEDFSTQWRKYKARKI
ncbi:MAG: serine/threonine protein phosphatase [Thermoplasmatales archaeon]|nr:serine/threonine protein phosphatase [Thermoplasmatales archaeon]